MKNLITPFVWLAFIVSLNGQTKHNYMGFGLRVGYGAASIANQNNYGQKEMDYGFHSGWTIGADIIRQLSKKGFLQVGASVMQGGQDYADSFSSRSFKKDVSYNTLGASLLYRHVFKKYDEEYVDHKSRLFLQIGAEGILISGIDMDHTLDGQIVSLNEFVLSGDDNPHQAFITQNATTAPADLFEKLGLGLVMGFGIEQMISQNNRLSFELRGGISVTDINAESWRLENRAGVYEASRNAYFMLNVGFIFGSKNHN